MFGVLNGFIYGALWFAAIVALGFTGWRAVRNGHFQAVSESYYGRKAQNLGVACLAIDAVVTVLFLRQLLNIVLAVVYFRQISGGLFFLLGAAVGGYFTYRYYARSY
ncbi:MAG: hypothetical protein KGJ86_12745 [Chloroflexota bacterium]|nr:hypothetical protein [Chloroflexota bacterium]